MRSHNLFTGFLFFLLISGLVSGLNAQNLTRGPYLQKPGSGSIVIKWRTDAPSDSRVRYGHSPGTLSQLVDDPGTTTEHRVEISGLNPSTTYYYSAGSTLQTLAGGDSLHRFRTSPVPGTIQPIRVWAIGDFGKGNEAQGRVRDSYLDWNGNRHTDVWLWLGDNAYDSGTDQEFTDKVFSRPFAYDSLFRYMPFMPTPGNHDYLSIAPPLTNIAPPSHSGPYYDIAEVPTNGEAGGVPSNMEAYYSFDYGNAHFVSLNSEIGSLLGSSNDWIGIYPLFNPFASAFSSSPFTDWLHNDLSANDKPWVIAYFHQPPYTDGSHESGTFWEIFMQAMRENITPILEQYGVDLVVCGHSHVYERSYLIKGHYDDPGTWNNSMLVDGRSGTDSIGEAYQKNLHLPGGNDGTVYVVTGNSGSADDNPGLNYPAHYFGYGCGNCYSSFVIDIHGDTLNGRCLSFEGNILDDFTILKAGATSLSESEAVFKGLEVFPNPFGEDFTIAYELENSVSVKIELLDVSGKESYPIFYGQQKSGRQQIKVNTQVLGISTGSYLLRIQAGEGFAVERLLKMR